MFVDKVMQSGAGYYRIHIEEQPDEGDAAQESRQPCEGPLPETKSLIIDVDHYLVPGG